MLQHAKHPAAIPELAPQSEERQLTQSASGVLYPAQQIKSMLEEGAPLGRVYEVASRAVAAHLVEGMNPDRQRAWTTLLRTLRQASAAEGEKLDRHPDYPGFIEDFVTAVLDELGPDAPAGIGGRIADRLEGLQAARAEEASTAPRRRAA